MYVCMYVCALCGFASAQAQPFPQNRTPASRWHGLKLAWAGPFSAEPHAWDGLKMTPQVGLKLAQAGKLAPSFRDPVIN